MERSLLQHFVAREINRNHFRCFAENCQINEGLLQRLHLEKELIGHEGCVNCLDWNSSGCLLASGSDDTNVILWDPFSHKVCSKITTGHRGNIFSVKFFPNSNDMFVASGAADHHVYVHDVAHKEQIHGFSCNGRVKRLVTSPDAPHNIWSASEDGTICEFDIREPSSACSKVIVDLTLMCGESAECKCLALSPTYSYFMAVGANDPYVRLYDRRMTRSHTSCKKQRDKMQLMEDNCVAYFVPGHLHHKQKEYRRRLRYLCATYLTFNCQGNEILVNVGGEQVYLYNIDQKQPTFHQQMNCHSALNINNGMNGHFTPLEPHYSGLLQPLNDAKNCLNMFETTSLTDEVEKIKEEANDCFCKKQFTNAIMMYNKAILKSPKSWVLFGNRAAAYIKRGWDGDVYAALRDCSTALLLNPNYAKASFRLVRCLYELNWLDEAKRFIIDFKSRHPEFAKNQACYTLEKDIKNGLKENKKQSSDNVGSVVEREVSLQNLAFDYSMRYCGHCNTTTDIKEANFLGKNGQFIIAGSDDGSFFVWERKTSNLVRVMRADESIVNCLQPHPSICMLATSGIDPLVRLWSPSCNETSDRIVEDPEKIAAANQRRMNTDPLETMLLSMGMRAHAELDNEDQGDTIPCRTS